MVRRLASAWLCALALAPAPVAAGPLVLAQKRSAAEPAPGSPKAVELAKKHFERARAAYGMGSYNTAIEELTQAIRYDPKGKDLVYNLALVHEKLGNIELAIENFKRVVAMESDPQERERIEQIVQRLEGARDEVAKEAPVVVLSEDEPVASEQPAERDQPRRGRFDGWVIATGGVAITAAVVGTVFGLRALGTRPSDSEATGPGTTPQDLRDRADEAHSYAVVADVAFVISLVSAGAAGFLYFTREAEPGPGNSTGSRTLVGVGGRF
jgi:tetratricopeptide (TPR) repeat protein